MQSRISAYYIYFLALVILGCSAAKPVMTSTQNTRYSEDLSIWRPKADPVPGETTTKTPTDTDGKKPATTVEAKYTVNKKLDNVLDSIDRYNIQRNFIDGFTIQVYSGSKKDDAFNAKKELQSTLPDLPSEVQYAQPNFRVKVGKYYTRVEAQKDLLDVKKLFPGAIIIPDKVSIN
ncbi:MAG: SPOR domain-containing protein [Chryseolinea sp.]